MRHPEPVGQSGRIHVTCIFFNASLFAKGRIQWSVTVSYIVSLIRESYSPPTSGAATLKYLSILVGHKK